MVLIRLDNIVCSFYFKDITQMRDSPFLQNLKKKSSIFLHIISRNYREHTPEPFTHNYIIVNIIKHCAIKMVTEQAFFLFKNLALVHNIYVIRPSSIYHIFIRTSIGHFSYIYWNCMGFFYLFLRIFLKLHS